MGVHMIGRRWDRAEYKARKASPESAAQTHLGTARSDRPGLMIKQIVKAQDGRGGEESRDLVEYCLSA